MYVLDKSVNLKICHIVILGYLKFCVAMVLSHCHKINVMTVSVNRGPYLLSMSMNRPDLWLLISQRVYCRFSIPPVLSDNWLTPDGRGTRHEDTAGRGEPTRLTSSAKCSYAGPRNTSISSHSRVHSSPALRKVRRKDAPSCGSERDRSGRDDPATESEKSPPMHAALPSDVELSPEVIVSFKLLEFLSGVDCISQYILGW